MCSSTTNGRTIFRNVVRLLTVLALPWFGDVLEEFVGFELEIEVELIVFLSFFVLGSFWCGWLCPFGNASYFVEKIGKGITSLGRRVHRKFTLQFDFSPKVDRTLRYVKYISLLLFLYVIYSHNENYFFSDHGDMYRSNPISHLFLQVKKWAILFVPLFIPRFFCKYLCFQKAAYNIVNFFSPITKIRRKASCVSCGKCDKVCEMKLPVSRLEKVTTDCVSCYNCMDVCPGKVDAIKLDSFGKERNVNLFIIIALTGYVLITIMAMLLLMD